MSNDADRSPGFKAFVIAMIVTTGTATLLRFWSRSIGSTNTPYVYPRFWWDDWIALAATVVTVALLVLLLRFVEDAGFGRHQDTLPPEQVVLFSKLLYVGDYLFDTSLFLSKQSALAFLSRIFPSSVSPRWLSIGIWATSCANIAWLVGTCIGTILFCDPIEKNWHPEVPGRCGTLQNLFIGSVVSSVVIDVAIMLLPLPRIWGLRTTRARKAGITIVFILGYCVIVVSLGRLITIVISASAVAEDITYEGVPFFYWVAAESPITILSICLPAMLPLGRHLSHHYFEPLTKLVSSYLSSASLSSYRSGGAIRSRSGNFSSTRSPYNNPPHAQDPTGDSSSRVKDRTYLNQPVGGRREALNLSTSDENYKAHIRKGDPKGVSEGAIPLYAIRVENDIRVSHGNHGRPGGQS